MSKRRIYGHVAFVLWIVLFYLSIGFTLWIIVECIRLVGDMEEARVTSPEGLSGRPSNTQSNLETPTTSDNPEEYIAPGECITLEEVKEILRMKRNQRGVR